MTFYAYYDPDTGEIIKVSTSSIEEGVSIVVPSLHATGYVEDGELKPHPTPAPSIYHKFDRRSGKWSDFRSQAMIEEAIRKQRSRLLAETDWTQLPDVSDQIKLKYADYRQALRDITNQAGFPNEINWPIEP